MINVQYKNISIIKMKKIFDSEKGFALTPRMLKPINNSFR